MWVKLNIFGILHLLHKFNLEYMNFKTILLIGSITFTLYSCIAPKELTVKYNFADTSRICYKPTDFMLFPSLQFEGWLTDMGKFHANIPQEVLRNQMGLKFTDRKTGRQTYFICPSASPRAILDTNLNISSSRELLGSWQVRYSQKLRFKDSVCFKDSSISRKIDVLDTNFEDAVILTFDTDNVSLYVKTPKSNHFYRRFSRRYKLLNNRFLLIYNNLHTNSATNFVVMNLQGELIWDNYAVVDELVISKYKTYQTIANRLVFKRMGNPPQKKLLGYGQ